MDGSSHLYCDDPRRTDIPFYGAERLRTAGLVNYTCDTTNTLAYKLVEDEKCKLLKRKDELAMKTAQAKFPTKAGMQAILDAEKQSLEALVQQREAISLSYMREMNSKRQDDFWDFERASRHFQRRLKDQYTHKHELLAEKMNSNVVGIKKVNEDLALQNARLMEEIEDLKLAHAQSLRLAEISAQQRSEVLSDDLNRESKNKLLDNNLDREAKLRQLLWTRRDLKKELDRLSALELQALHRNNCTQMTTSELSYRSGLLASHEDCIHFDRVGSKEVMASLRQEQAGLRATISHLESRIEAEERSHQIAKSKLLGRHV